MRNSSLILIWAILSFQRLVWALNIPQPLIPGNAGGDSMVGLPWKPGFPPLLTVTRPVSTVQISTVHVTVPASSTNILVSTSTQILSPTAHPPSTSSSTSAAVYEQDAPERYHRLSPGVIAATCIGGITLLVSFVLLLLWIRCRRARCSSEPHPTTPSPFYSTTTSNKETEKERRARSAGSPNHLNQDRPPSTMVNDSSSFITELAPPPYDDRKRRVECEGRPGGLINASPAEEASSESSSTLFESGNG
ncbi:hypothetical protein E1B28_009468 [Marasmius oreades]|uniref:Uncharacterized protein n=1 Tax=Marasmius oreades TaxID=181124 RepID=A0A9P7UQH4_9AGAR|nr:uncharacterized protein E1B28_009468 [Marasmius oreades]KAG7090348.1 hypothetical protein E1B28_009468 [Marasmius oreades]